MNILIFGGSGFIGRHFRDYFKSNNEITIHSYDLHPDKDSHYLDVREYITLPTELFSKGDIIINLAAVHRTPGSPDYDYFETNIKGAKNVCDFALRAGIDHIIFTSSIAPYGASEEEKNEETLPTPNTPYGISKLVAEFIHREWASKANEKRLLILRPGVVFGKGENGNFTRLAKTLRRGFFLYPGRKDTIKACIYVKDLVAISWQLIMSQTSNIELYNFAYYPNYTIEGIVNTMVEVTKKDVFSIVISGSILRVVAQIIQLTGLSKLGIHPDRVKKLMISTNVNGVKLRLRIEKYNYTLSSAIKDWYSDCEKDGFLN